MGKTSRRVFKYNTFHTLKVYSWEFGANSIISCWAEAPGSDNITEETVNTEEEKEYSAKNSGNWNDTFGEELKDAVPMQVQAFLKF